MTHNELISYGKNLGLHVETSRYRDHRLQLDVYVASFYLLPATALNNKHVRESMQYITGYQLHYDMDQMEYRDALAKCENNLRQFANWS